MRSALLCVVLGVGIATSVLATPQGFTTDFAQAKQEAKETGKLIFTYFHLNG